MLNTAVVDDLIATNPCWVRGAGQSKRVKKIVPASLVELETLTTAIPGGVKTHLHDHAAMGGDGLLFPAQHGEPLAPSTLYRVLWVPNRSSTAVTCGVTQQ